MEADTITTWFHRLADGDQQAADQIWQRYWTQMLSHARAKLAKRPLRAADEEDVALSAMHSFFKGVANQRFPNINDRDDLRALLLLMTTRKVTQHRRKELRVKRGAGKVAAEVDVTAGANETGAPLLEAVIGREPTPELAAIFCEQIEILLSSLESESLREIALRKLEGFTNQEIAEQIQRTTRSVERKLKLIREIWSSVDPAS